MGIIRFNVSLMADTNEARDRVINTFYLNDTVNLPGAATDYQGLCNDALALWQTAWYTSLGLRELRVTAYDVGPPPQYPKATAVVNENAPAVGTGTLGRELAMCLSYYSEQNRPRQRGRMYLAQIGTGAFVSVPRPTQALADKAGALAQGLADLGGLDIDWSVYSKTDNQARAVTDAWVDNAWDVQRRRGLDATARWTYQPGP